MVTWTGLSIAAGASKTLTLNVLVSASATNGTVLLNTANVAGVIGQDMTTVQVTQTQADLSVTKTGTATVQQGGTLLYTVTALNAGPAAAQNVVVADVIPAGLTFNAGLSTQGCVLNGTSSSVLCNNTALASGESKAFTVAFNVPSTATCGSVIQNQATVSASTTDPNTANNTSQTVSTTVQCQNPTFTITKSDGKTIAAPGETLPYTITITNTSQVNGTSVTVTDTLPALTTFVSASDGGTHSSGVVTWTGLSIAAGASKTLTLNVLVSASATNGTVLLNTANVAGVIGQDMTTVQVTQTQADLSVTKTGTATVQQGGTLLYTVTALNAGPAAAQNVVVADVIPAGLTFNAGLSTQGCVLNGTSSSVLCNNTTLASGESKAFTIAFNVPATATCGSVIQNQATVSASTTDPTQSNNTSQTVSTTVQCQNASFTISKTDGKTTTAPGEALPYTITVTNTSTTAATNVTVTDTLPALTTFVSASDGGTHSSGVVTWTGLSIAAGASKTLTLNATVNAGATNGTVLLNTANVAGVVAQDSTTVQTGGTPTFVISKTDNRSTATPGDTLTYVITVTNTSQVNGTNVTVTDSLPTQVTYLLASDSGTHASGVITWTGLSIAAGATKTLTVIAQVNSGVANGTVITNTAAVNGVTAQDTTTVQTSPGQNLTITLTDSKDPVAPCENFTYTVTVTNLSSTALSNQEIRLSLGSSVTFLSASDNGTNGSSLVTWTGVSIGAGSSVTRTAYVKASCSATDGQILRSTAYINSLSVEQTTNVNDNEVEADNISLSVTDNPDPVMPGEELRYDIRVCNNDSSSTTIDLTALLDSDTSYLSSSNGGDNYDSTDVRWDSLSISGNSCQTVIVRVRVRRSASEGDTLRLTARTGSTERVEYTRVTCDGSDCEYDPYDPYDPVGPVQITVDKQADRREVQPGSIVSYTVIIRNGSAETAQEIDVNDSFSAGSLTVEDAAGGNVSGNSIHWSIPVLGPNASRVITYRVRIDPSMRHGQVISNTVTVSSPDIAGSPSDTEQVSVIENMPQTGLGGFIAAVTDSDSFIRPHQRGAAETSAQTDAGTSLPLLIWTNIIAIGISGGWLFGKRILF